MIDIGAAWDIINWSYCDGGPFSYAEAEYVTFLLDISDDLLEECLITTKVQFTPKGGRHCLDMFIDGIPEMSF